MNTHGLIEFKVNLANFFLAINVLDQSCVSYARKKNQDIIIIMMIQTYQRVFGSVLAVIILLK